MRLKPLSQNYGTPTTRRHPRSLSEAFPQDHADPIEHYPSARSWWWSDRIIAALLVGVLAMVLLGGCAHRGAGYVPLVDLRVGQESQFPADLAQCQAYATQRMDAAQGAAAGAIVGALLGAVLAPRGWRNEAAAYGAVLGAGSGGVQANQTRESITKLCLAGRGYSVLN